MSTTVQQIKARAEARSVANRGGSLWEPGGAGDLEVVQQVNLAQQALVQRLAVAGRPYRLTTGAVTSSASVAGAPRTVTLPAALRVLLVRRTTDGVRVTLVDPREDDAEWGPRAYVSVGVSGVTLTEVAPSWATGDPTAVGLTVTYASAVALLSALTDAIAIPDAYADLLDNRLARYLAEKDVGRDAAELDTLDAQYEKRLADCVSYVDLASGTEVQASVRPAPEAKP